ncbi:MAG: PEP-CTERM sorting domain-containing protein [Opitutaceae bacterium]|jgi:autotransporter-associated beta strand protein|nr:PEP-CTERM sorting domain-containing protein [Opitutaceae bacterium]
MKIITTLTTFAVRFSPVGCIMTGTLFSTAPLHAQNIRAWDNGGSTTNWSEAANWSDDTVPGNAYEAQLGDAASGTIDVPDKTAQPRAIRFLDTGTSVTDDITVRMASGTTWRLIVPGTGGGVFVDGGTRNQTLDLNGGTLILGQSSTLGLKDVCITNNGAGRLVFTPGNLNMTGTNGGDAGASVHIKFDGTGTVTVDSNLGMEATTNPTTFLISQTGSGATTLNGANTWNGATTVSAGALWVNGTHTGGAAWSVTGGTLGGSGTITTAGDAGVIIGTGGKLSAGAESATGTLTMNLGAGSLDLGAALTGDSASLLFRLGATDASDKIALGSGSSLNIGSGVLDFGDFVFTTGEGFGAGTYILISTTTTIVGTLADGQLSGAIGGFEAKLALAADNKALLLTVVTAVPEPATTAILLGGLCGILVTAFRKHRRTTV